MCPLQPTAALYEYIRMEYSPATRMTLPGGPFYN